MAAAAAGRPAVPAAGDDPAEVDLSVFLDKDIGGAPAVNLRRAVQGGALPAETLSAERALEHGSVSDEDFAVMLERLEPGGAVPAEVSVVTRDYFRVLWAYMSRSGMFHDPHQILLKAVAVHRASFRGEAAAELEHAFACVLFATKFEQDDAYHYLTLQRNFFAAVLGFVRMYRVDQRFELEAVLARERYLLMHHTGALTVPTLLSVIGHLACRWGALGGDVGAAQAVLQVVRQTDYLLRTAVLNTPNVPLQALQVVCEGLVRLPPRLVPEHPSSQQDRQVLLASVLCRKVEETHLVRRLITGKRGNQAALWSTLVRLLAPAEPAVQGAVYTLRPDEPPTLAALARFLSRCEVCGRSPLRLLATAGETRELQKLLDALAGLVRDSERIPFHAVQTVKAKVRTLILFAQEFPVGSLVWQLAHRRPRVLAHVASFLPEVGQARGEREAVAVPRAVRDARVDTLEEVLRTALRTLAVHWAGPQLGSLLRAPEPHLDQPSLLALARGMEASEAAGRNALPFFASRGSTLQLRQLAVAVHTLAGYTWDQEALRTLTQLLLKIMDHLRFAKAFPRGSLLWHLARRAPLTLVHIAGFLPTVEPLAHR